VVVEHRECRPDDGLLVDAVGNPKPWLKPVIFGIEIGLPDVGNRPGRAGGCSRRRGLGVGKGIGIRKQAFSN